MHVRIFIFSNLKTTATKSLANLLYISALVLTFLTVKAHINRSLTALRGFGCSDWINLTGTYHL